MERVRACNGTAVALSADVPAGEVHPVILDGVLLAVWRDQNNSVHLWEDRCPHRGMRLSFGFVQNDRLTCLYHGWEYDTDGACKRIPAHPELEPPETLCATTLEVAERWGMIFSNGTSVAGENAECWHGVRTVFLDAPSDSVCARLPSVSDDGWSKDEAVFHGTSGEHRLALAVQPVDDAQTALHLSTTNADIEHRQSLARDMVAYRGSLSSGAS